ncbi:MAG: c-type cytochrome [Acidobacteriota bacterium]
MRMLAGFFSLALGLTLAMAGRVAAQAPAASPAQGSPAWAYGLPPAGGDPAGGRGAPPAGTGAQPVARGGRAAPDTSLKHIPGSTAEFTIAQIRDFFNVADWMPDDHPPMPDVVVHGRAPSVRGCAMCHMPSGKGRPENAPVAGLPYDYIVQQLSDFKHDLRTSADTRKTNTAQMIEAAKNMTDEEIKAAAAYFSSMKWTPWIKIVETNTVPKTRISGNVFFPIPDAGTEPIGHRIIETPEDTSRFELRDPHSGFIAYVPSGSVKKGAALVASGGGKTLPCIICHGADLHGIGPVPGIAGRSPSYIVRQLYDIQQGTRKGVWSPLMVQVVSKLTQDDMIAIAAYVSSRGQ